MNILIADDHYLYLKGLRMLLGGKKSGLHYFEAKDLSSVLGQLEDHPIDLLLLDLRMPDMEGFDGVYQIHEQYPDLPIVIVTSSESRSDIQATINLGLQGYILKSLEHDTMVQALNEVVAGNPWFPDLSQPLSGPLENLTNRQLEILHLINDGMGNREIGKRLKITEGTVGQHVHALLSALRVKNRSEAARILRQYE